jgi:hypothetical protein
MPARKYKIEYSIPLVDLVQMPSDIVDEYVKRKIAQELALAIVHETPDIISINTIRKNQFDPTRQAFVMAVAVMPTAEYEQIVKRVQALELFVAGLEFDHPGEL